MEKPSAPAYERNRQPILEKLTYLLKDKKEVLEIGSGTGQHAVYFAKHLSHLFWQASDLNIQIAGIQRWVDEAKLPNILPPIVLDVTKQEIEHHRYDCVFTANTMHYMPHKHVESLVQNVGCHLKPDGLLIIYGPFNEHGAYTSQSNAQFDLWLKEKNPEYAIRDLDDIVALCLKEELYLNEKINMPANNLMVCFAKACL